MNPKIRRVLGLTSLCSILAVGIAGAQQDKQPPPPAPTTPATAEKPAEPEKAVIGKPFKAFTRRDLTSEEKATVDLSSFKGKKIVVGIFMANQCGTTWTYERKIGEMIKEYAPKDIQVVAVHANYNETDAEILGQIEQRNLAIPVLDDKPTQEIASYINARCTPTFFVVDKQGILQYIGAFDKFGKDPYIRPVLTALLNGKKVPYTKTTAFG